MENTNQLVPCFAGKPNRTKCGLVGLVFGFLTTCFNPCFAFKKNYKLFIANNKKNKITNTQSNNKMTLSKIAPNKKLLYYIVPSKMP